VPLVGGTHATVVVDVDDVVVVDDALDRDVVPELLVEVRLEPEAEGPVELEGPEVVDTCPLPELDGSLADVLGALLRPPVDPLVRAELPFDAPEGWSDDSPPKPL
jgi:hypothetical protein